jgi:hypothetical protein
MKKVILYISFAVFLLACLISTAQVSQQQMNLEKYWKYRERLKNVVVVGDCLGCSLPAKGRGIGGDKDDNGILADPKDEGDIDFPDQGIRLGTYIGMLATEYKVLSMYGKNTDNTIRELYYALEAFNRIDNSAEGWWRYYYMGNPSYAPYSDGSDLNGFFIRDDIPFHSDAGLPDFQDQIVDGDLVENLLNKSFAPPDDKYKAKYISSSFYKGINRVGVDFHHGECNFDGRISGPTEESQDQVCVIYEGLALVTKLVPVGNNFEGRYFLDGATNDITVEAKKIMNRISQNMVDNDWLITNSVTGSCVTGLRWDEFVSSSADRCKCNDGGARAGSFSYGMALANSYAQTYYVSKGLADAYYDANYSGATLYASKNIEWPTFESWPHNNSEVFLVMTLGAICSPWGEDHTLGVLEDHANDSDHEGKNLLTPLIYRTLFHPDATINTVEFDNMYQCALDQAPSFGNLGDGSTFMWGGEDMNLHGVFGGVGSGIEWSGLSYMLMFNLYNITHPSYLSGTTYKVYDPLELAPVDLVKEGTVLRGEYNIESDHKNFIASNSIVAKASSGGVKYVIANDDDVQPAALAKADVNFMAGSFVQMAPGFEVHQGAEFHAFINTDVKPMDVVTIVDADCREELPEDLRSMQDNSNEGSNPVQLIDHRPSSVVVQSPKVENNSNLLVSPNPSGGKFSVSAKRNGSPVGVNGILVYDISGKIVWKTGASASSDFDIDISQYPEGTYYVQCTNAMNEVTIKKMIKQ